MPQAVGLILTTSLFDQSACRLHNICKRLEELANYAEAKCEQIAQREKTGERRFAEQDRKRQEAADEVAAHHAAEAEEALKDQQQAKAELDPRNVEEEDAGGKPSEAK